MRLTHVKVQLFRNIVDSTEVAIQPDVTCLVGRNESGKSTFLHAVYRLNPARPNVRFDVSEQYPAWREKKDRLRGRLDEATPVTAAFALDERDLAALEARFGAGALTQPTVTVTRNYAGSAVYAFDVNEAAVVAHVLRDPALPVAAAERAGQATTLADLQERSREFARAGDVTLTRAAAAIDARIATLLGEAVSVRQAIRDLLVPRVPKFFFFDDYATLTGRLAIRRLLTENPEHLDDEELTGLSLLTLAGADANDLLNASYERRRREMESVANTLTEDALKFWSQNTGLRVLIDLTQPTGLTQPAAADPGTADVDHELHIRLWDARHYLSLPFDQRSSGFRWFFSFLAAFAPYEWAQEPMIILLDEPALGLHARAQRDFLRFINERLAVNGHQVIYSTHSPFMIEADHLDRVRIVEDRGRDAGSVVTADLATADPESLSPLQAAVGTAWARQAFGDRSLLLVDSLDVCAGLASLSAAVTKSGGQGLDARWLLLPAAGAQALATLTALSGGGSRAAVLIGTNGDQAGIQFAEAAARGALKGLPIVTYAEILGSGTATFADLFAGDDRALAHATTAGASAGNDFHEETLARAARLFARINALSA